MAVAATLSLGLLERCRCLKEPKVKNGHQSVRDCQSRATENDEWAGEFVKGLASGLLPLNTIAQTLGYDVAEAESGRVAITLDPTVAHLNPWGTVHVRAITPETGQIRAERKGLSCGKRVGTAEGRVTDTMGRLLAHGTTTCLIFPI